MSPPGRSPAVNPSGMGAGLDGLPPGGRPDHALRVNRTRRTRDMTPHEQLLEQLRPASFAIAYRMLGSVAEAEDIVQEALMTVDRELADGEEIKSPRAFVSTVTTRLAIDNLRSARVRRERYVGEWLPEPLLTDGSDDPAHRAEMADSISTAM